MGKIHLCKNVLVLTFGILLVFTSMPIKAHAQEQDDTIAETEQRIPVNTDVVEVSDAATLLAAIQPNLTIRLLPGDYNLSTLIASNAV